MAAISYHETVHDVQAIEWETRVTAERRDGLAAVEQAAVRPVYAVAEDASGGVVFPLRQRGRRLETLRERHSPAWRPLATAYASSDSLSIALAGALATRASHIVLDGLPDEDGTARQLERAFAKAGWIVARVQCGGADPDSAPLYRLECWRRSDPRNWPTLTGRKIRALVSPSPRG